MGFKLASIVVELLLFNVLNLSSRGRQDGPGSGFGWPVIFLLCLCHLTFSGLMAYIFCAPELPYKGLLIAQCLSAGPVIFFTRQFQQSVTIFPVKISASGRIVFWSVALFTFLATLPDLTPTWGNVDLGTHIAIMRAFEATLNGATFIHQPLGVYINDYSYVFGFHFLATYLGQMLGLDVLTSLHVAVSILMGALAFVSTELLKGASGFIKITALAFLMSASGVFAFIQGGWAAHFFGTTICYLFCLFGNELYEQKATDRFRPPVFFEWVMMFLCFASYPFFLPVSAVYIFMQRVSIDPSRRSKFPFFGVIAVCILAALPLLGVPEIFRNVASLCHRILGGSSGVPYPALSSNGARPAFALWEAIAYGGIGVVLLLKYAEQNVAKIYISFGLTLVGISLVVSPTSYVLSKAGHSFAPILLVSSSFLADRIFRISNRRRGLSKILLRGVSIGGLALLATIIFHPSQSRFTESSKLMISRDELRGVDYLQDKMGLDLGFIGVDGPKEFLIRKYLQKDGGPFHRNEYYISPKVSLDFYLPALLANLRQAKETLLWVEDGDPFSDAALKLLSAKSEFKAKRIEIFRAAGGQQHDYFSLPDEGRTCLVRAGDAACKGLLLSTFERADACGFFVRGKVTPLKLELVGIQAAGTTSALGESGNLEIVLADGKDLRSAVKNGEFAIDLGSPGEGMSTVTNVICRATKLAALNSGQ